MEFSSDPVAAATNELEGAHERTCFLDLPAEVRNIIYQNIIDDGPPARLLAKCKKNIAINSPMLYVNKQISSEYHSLAAAISPVIETHVHNYNFNYLAAYLNRLSELDAARFTKGTSKAPARVVQVTLSESDRKASWGMKVDDRRLICRWLKRMENVDKAGSEIEITYKCKPVQHDTNLPDDAARDRDVGLERMYLLDYEVHRLHAQERAWAEWLKIRAALICA